MGTSTLDTRDSALAAQVWSSQGKGVSAFLGMFPLGMKVSLHR